MCSLLIRRAGANGASRRPRGGQSIAPRSPVHHRYTQRPMNDLTGTAASGQRNELSRSLRPRHVSMITIGGIIGAGLFVGSSVAIAAAGPAVIVSYILTGFLVLLV